MNGEKHDENKNRLELIPPESLLYLGQVLTFGANKYEPWGWVNVDRATERYYGAALRHLMAWANGNPIDKESGLPHLAHALCNIVFLLELDIKNETISRPST